MADLDQPPPILSPQVSLKRKRPPGIQIPTILREIPADVAEMSNPDGAVSFSGIGVGVFSVKGKKKFIEDTYKIVSSCSNGIKGFFGVYDGHGGRKAANFAAENLHTNIFEKLKNSTTNEPKEETVQAGYLKTDKDFLKQGVTSGTCCVTALIEGDKILISNLGDCRAVLCRGGAAEALTVDHRAGNDDEKKRIESKGGYVEMHRGAWRVHGVLSVSRSIGDAHLKDWVVAEPDTKILHLSLDMEFLILASDGLWEKVGNQEAVDIAKGSITDQKKLSSCLLLAENDVKFNFFPKSNPVSKLHRVPLMEQKKRIQWKEDEFPSENDSPPLKTRRVTVQFQDQENSKIIQEEDEFPSESPPLKTRRVTVQFQDQENSKIIRKEDEFLSENEGPPLKTGRVTVQFQDQENSKIRKEDEFPSENEGPLLKTRRVTVQFQDQENSNSKRLSNSCALVSSCNELVHLAQIRGSLDDITVMIIDLNHFK